ncbi:MAG: serine/threonine-protein kinase [Myxococcota bacterium]
MVRLPSELPEYGERLGDRYRIDAEIARGGVGVVFRAMDLEQKRPVAVKVLPASLDRGSKRARFLREVRHASEVTHPHLVQVQDAGFFAGQRPFLVMELLEGRSLHTQVRNVGPLTPARACVVAAQAASAVAALHDVGLLHRDVKPANVFLLQGDRVHAKLIDLGMSKRVGDGDPSVTAPGKVIGTPSYMAPEVLRGQNVGPAADVFGIGQTLYESLTGTPMIAPRRDIAATFEAVLQEPVRVPSTRRPDVPAAVDEVVRRACAKNPAHRYASALALMDACEEAGRRAAAHDAQRDAGGAYEELP